MGCCLSKKGPSPLNAAAAPQPVDVCPRKFYSNSLGGETMKFSLNHKEGNEQEQDGVKVKEESLAKDEIFVVYKHRKSQDLDEPSPPPPTTTNPSLLVNKKNVPPMETAPASGVPAKMGIIANNVSNGNEKVRTSSCTKEEVDAILIQCGRLSCSNSTGTPKAASGRKYSGSKRRSFDFDNNCADADARCKDDEDNEETVVAGTRQHRQRHRHRRQSPSSSPSQGRRRTPSREREQGCTSSERRLSRSPARKRSETNPNANKPVAADSRRRPARMLSVPASLAMDETNHDAENPTQIGSAIKRLSVKRCSSPVTVNVGEGAAAVVGSRATASPRSRSPARANAKGRNDNNQRQQQPSLSGSSSRKSKQSPYRRNPFTEIDQNSLPYIQPTASKVTCVDNSSSGSQPKNKEIDGKVAAKESNSALDQVPMQKSNIETTGRIIIQGTNSKGRNNDPEEQHQNVEEAKGQTRLTGNVVKTTAIPSGVDGLNPHALTRSRSARRSRDLDLNPESLFNPMPSSYTALLLEDIQNFHQKNNTPSFSVPPCVSKAFSIVEAVADLNSTTSSNLSSAFSNGRRSILPAVAAAANLEPSQAREPFLESEIPPRDDLTEPSFHKYITVRRGGMLCGDDRDEQESSGSNSFVDGSQQHLGPSASSWEPNSADSTDHWASRSNTSKVDDEKSPLGFQKHASSEPGHGMEEARRKGFSGQRTGIRGRKAGTARNLHATPVIAAATASP